MAVFETIRIYKGRAVFLVEHLTRLKAACQDSNFPVSPERLDGAANFLVQVARKGATTEPHGVARLHVTAGDGGMTDPARNCRVLVSFEPRRPPSAKASGQGLRFVRCPKPHHPVFNARKTHNYWANLDALAWARGQGADEALLGDDSGRLLSACVGNIFVVQNGRLCTPRLAGGTRAGVVRAWVMSNFDTDELDINIADDAIDTVLYTNSWMGVAVMHELGETMLNYSVIESTLGIAMAYKSVLGD